MRDKDFTLVILSILNSNFETLLSLEKELNRCCLCVLVGKQKHSETDKVTECVGLCIWEVFPKLFKWTHRSLVCHVKHKQLELSSGAFPPSLRGGTGSATAAFLCVLPLRPSEYLDDNGHVAND